MNNPDFLEPNATDVLTYTPRASQTLKIWLQFRSLHSFDGRLPRRSGQPNSTAFYVRPRAPSVPSSLWRSSSYLTIVRSCRDLGGNQLSGTLPSTWLNLNSLQWMCVHSLPSQRYPNALLSIDEATASSHSIAAARSITEHHLHPPDPWTAT